DDCHETRLAPDAVECAGRGLIRLVSLEVQDDRLLPRVVRVGARLELHERDALAAELGQDRELRSGLIADREDNARLGRYPGFDLDPLRGDGEEPGEVVGTVDRKSVV